MSHGRKKSVAKRSRSKKGAGDKILVSMRGRPLNKIEKGMECSCIWNFTETSLAELEDDGQTPTGKVYNYDMVFSPEDDTNLLYEKQCRPIVMSAMEGYNGTVFAYGQTSSGKTWTLMGDPQHHPGVTILAIRDIFKYVQAHPHKEWNVTCCYMEIYNETITDLLMKDRKKAYNLPIMEDKVFGPMPKGITTVGVHDAQHCLDVLASGEAHRSFAATDMNANSSRSHTLFRVRIQGKTAQGGARTDVKANMTKVADGLFLTKTKIQADRCSLFLLDNKAKEMYIQAGDITLRLPIGAGIAGTVAKSGETINISDAYADPRFKKDIDMKTGYRTQSILCMAVRGTKQIVGVVQYINKKDGSSFSDADVMTVSDMITTLGPIIETCQMMTKVCTTSGLNLVDLAGSERADKTGAKGAQLKEGANINKSLMMLGRCIQMLSSGSKGHVPFRNSKLTRLLSTSLGGNAKTAIMCAFSPASRNRGETISTMQFASRAKTIVNQAKQNKKSEGAALSKAYEDEIRKLKDELASAAPGGMTEEEKQQMEEEKKKQQEDHEKEIEYLKQGAEQAHEELARELEHIRLEQQQELERVRIEQEKLLEERRRKEAELREDARLKAEKMEEESAKMRDLHRAESRRMSQEVTKVHKESSKQIAELVSRNSLLQVRARKAKRDVATRDAKLHGQEVEIEQLRLDIVNERADAEKTERSLTRELSDKDEEMSRMRKKHGIELAEKSALLETVQAKVDELNAKLALQNDALEAARTRADEAAKNTLLTAGLVKNLEREMETLKSGIKVYRDFFVKWQETSNRG